MASEKDDLIYRYLRGDASEQDMDELRAYLAENPGAMRDIFLAAETERDLYGIFGGQKATSAVDPVTASSRIGSSRRAPVRRVRRIDNINSQQNVPLMIAASVALCVLLLLAFSRSSSPKQTITKRETPASPVTPPLDVARKNSEHVRRATQQELATLEARRKMMQERLVQIESESKTLADSKPREADAEEAARRANIDRVNAERLKVESELAEMKAAQAELKQSLQNEVVAIKPVETPVAPVAPQPQPQPAAVAAAQLGQVVYISAASPAPMLIRGRGQAAIRIPVTRGMQILQGDRLESGKSDGARAGNVPEARVAVELFNGAIVDVAEQSIIEWTNIETVKLERGQIYADVDLKHRQKRAAGQPGLYQVVFTTAAANVLIEGTRFDLYADASFTRLRMEEGRTTISNKLGSQKVTAFEESAARLTTAPGKPYMVTPDQIWRGRLNVAQTAVINFTLINSETNQPIAEFEPLKTGTELNLAKLPTRKLSVRANTIPDVVGSVRFGLNANANYNLEQVHPYSLNDDNDVNYRPWTPAPGTYTINATPSMNRDGKGETGIAASITITVVDKP